MLSAYGPLTVIIVADDPLVRVGLTNLLEAEGVSVTAAVSGDELSVEQGDAEVLLWDADPDLDAEAIGQQAVPVLALVSEDETPNQLLTAGAAGILYRTAAAEHLATGLRAVAAGLTVLEPNLLAPLLPTVPERDTLFDDLTPREVVVLELVSEGLPNKRIAKELGISVNTVKFHVNALLSKFGAKTRTELAVRSVQQGQTNL